MTVSACRARCWRRRRGLRLNVRRASSLGLKNGFYCDFNDQSVSSPRRPVAREASSETRTPKSSAATSVSRTKTRTGPTRTSSGSPRRDDGTAPRPTPTAGQRWATRPPVRPMRAAEAGRPSPPRRPRRRRRRPGTARPSTPGRARGGHARRAAAEPRGAEPVGDGRAPSRTSSPGAARAGAEREPRAGRGPGRGRAGPAAELRQRARRARARVLEPPPRRGGRRAAAAAAVDAGSDRAARGARSPPAPRERLPTQYDLSVGDLVVAATARKRVAVGDRGVVVGPCEDAAEKAPHKRCRVRFDDGKGTYVTPRASRPGRAARGPARAGRRGHRARRRPEQVRRATAASSWAAAGGAA